MRQEKYIKRRRKENEPKKIKENKNRE